MREQDTGVRASDYQPYICLSYEVVTSAGAIVSLKGMGCRPFMLRPITVARRGGSLNGNGLILQYQATATTVHRVHDAAMEGKEDVVWVGLSVCHLRTGRVMNTNIPLPCIARFERAAYVMDASGRARTVAGWLTDMSDNTSL